jgi:hypothetical protein
MKQGSFCNRLTDGGECVNLTSRPRFITGRIPGTHLCWRLGQVQGHSVIFLILSSPVAIQSRLFIRHPINSLRNALSRATRPTHHKQATLDMQFPLGTVSRLVHKLLAKHWQYSYHVVRTSLLLIIFFVELSTISLRVEIWTQDLRAWRSNTHVTRRQAEQHGKKSWGFAAWRPIGSVLTLHASRHDWPAICRRISHNSLNFSGIDR